MKYEIEITKAAQNDFEDIYTYISESLCNKQAAVKIVAMIDKNIRSLTDMPERYPFVNSQYLRDNGIRFVSVKNYIVFYMADESRNKVYIVRILYEKRNWAEILKNEL